MSLIVLERATLSFGPRQILDGATLGIDESDRIGLVGANGTGKSTLLRVLIGQQSLDGGQVNRVRGCRVGYLPQEAIEVAHGPLLAATLSAVPGRADLSGRLERAEEELGQAQDPEEQMRLATQFAELQDRLDHFERYYSEHQAMRILKGLGFREADFQRQTTELSGGWRMRAALAGLLFQQPDVLFLDEPTNHLDMPSVVWFDQFLESYKSALVLICHDREFLNRHIQRVVSFEPEGLRFYRGNYDSYLQQRAAEEEVLEAQARNRERQIREMERFVERFRAKATKARQAQSRARQIEKLQQEIEPPVLRPKRLRFRFPDVERSGRDVLTLEGVDKAYGENVLYDDLSCAVYASDRIAIVGANGVGKTTLLKIMAGELAVDAGTVRHGANVKLGYFAQHHTELLDRRRTVLAEVWSQCPGSGESYVRGVCGAFLFSGDDVDKPIAILSGGERARVLVARLLVNPGNLLLMDEPTTHLDIHAAEALAEALAEYAGTLIFVSHNRAFVNRLATKIWDVVQGQIVEYPGNLAEYFEHQSRWARQDETAPSEPEPAGPVGVTPSARQEDGPASKESGAARGAGLSPGPSGGKPRPGAERSAQDVTARGAGLSPGPSGGKPRPGAERSAQDKTARKERRRREAELRNAISRRVRPMRQAVEKLERQIEALEQERRQLEPQLADPLVHADKDRYLGLLRRYEAAGRDLHRMYAEWEQKQQELEQLAAEAAEQEQG